MEVKSNMLIVFALALVCGVEFIDGSKCKQVTLSDKLTPADQCKLLKDAGYPDCEPDLSKVPDNMKDFTKAMLDGLKASAKSCNAGSSGGCDVVKGAACGAEFAKNVNCDTLKAYKTCINNAKCLDYPAFQTVFADAKKNGGCSSGGGSVPMCDGSNGLTTLVNSLKTGKAECDALLAAGQAGKDTDDLKCPCFTHVSKEQADANFKCYFNAKDKAAGKTLSGMWKACGGKKNFTPESRKKDLMMEMKCKSKKQVYCPKGPSKRRRRAASCTDGTEAALKAAAKKLGVPTQYMAMLTSCALVNNPLVVNEVKKQLEAQGFTKPCQQPDVAKACPKTCNKCPGSAGGSGGSGGTPSSPQASCYYKHVSGCGGRCDSRSIYQCGGKEPANRVMGYDRWHNRYQSWELCRDLIVPDPDGMSQAEAKQCMSARCTNLAEFTLDKSNYGVNMAGPAQDACPV